MLFGRLPPCQSQASNATQTGTLDHPNAADPDDSILLRFGFSANDTDGDHTAGTITINVKDDGPDAHNDINNFNFDNTHLTATGNVRIKTDSQDATGAKATFDPDTLILKLSGNVTVVNAQGKLNGPELTINLKTNNSVFKGNKGGRVTGVFTPQ